MNKFLYFVLSVLVFLFLSTEASALPKSAVLIDEQTGRLLFGQEKDERLPMASTTKIMTALLALEQPDIDEFFIVDSNAILVEGSAIGLKKGDSVSLRSLAEGMLLESGNDAANAAAVRIGGSIPDFAMLMNDRAQEIGMTNTNFVTPSGLDSEEHFSTAYDMALLAREALQNPFFSKICASKDLKSTYGSPPTEHYFYNHNRLLSLVEGAKGVKTGFTKKSGRCLVSAAERDGVSLICVTLCCPGDWNYHKEKYEEYFAALSSFKLSEQKVSIPVAGGIKGTASAVSEIAALSLFDGEEERIAVKTYCLPFLFAPLEKGEKVGKVQYFLDGTLAAETALVLSEKIDIKEKEKSFWQELINF